VLLPPLPFIGGTAAVDEDDSVAASSSAGAAGTRSIADTGAVNTFGNSSTQLIAVLIFNANSEFLGFFFFFFSFVIS
jgi:hypothetical protein